MNGVRISELPAASVANRTDQIEVNQAGVSRSLALSLLGGMTARAHGAVGDGIADDTAKLQAALDAALDAQQSLTVEPGTYKFTSLVIPAGSTMTASGAVFRSSGTLNNAAVPSIDVGDDVTIDELHYSTPGGEVDKCAVWLGSRANIGRIVMRADTQRGGSTAVLTRGQDIRVGLVDIDSFDYGYTIFNDTSTVTSGSWLGHVLIRSYIRGVKITFHRDWTIGDFYIHVRSPNANPDFNHAQGDNGFLFGGAYDGTFGSGVIADSNEHAIRLAGSARDAPGSLTLYGKSENIHGGVVKVLRPRGCAFKINSSSLFSPGVSEKVHNVSLDGLYCSGNMNPEAGNKEFIRCTHGRNIRIGMASCVPDPGATLSCQSGLRLNDTDGLTIGHLHVVGSNGNAVLIMGDSDTDGVSTFGGPVKNVSIGKLTGGICPGYVVTMTTPSFPVGPITLAGIDLPGGITATKGLLFIQDPAQVFAGPFHLSGYVGGGVTPDYSGPLVDDVTYDILYGTRRLVGRPTNFRFTARHELVVPALDPGDVAPNGIYLTAATATAGVNAYGGSIGFSRIGSSRRGGAVTIKQTGGNANDTGPAFFVGATVVSADVLREAGWFDHNRALWLSGALHTGTPASSVGSAYSVGALDNDVIFAGSGITTVTLPPFASNAGRTLGFVNRANFSVISAASDVQPKTGGASGTAILPATPGAWCEMKSDGTKWIILRSGT